MIASLPLTPKESLWEKQFIQMKNYILMPVLSLLIIGFYTGCINSKPEGYTLIGDVKNIPSKYIYLKIMPPVFERTVEDYDIPARNIVDSALVTNGHFEFHSKCPLKESGNASLSYKSKDGKFEGLIIQSKKMRTPDFIIENAEITFKGDSPEAVSMKGSPETELFYRHPGFSPSKAYFKLQDSLKTALENNNPTDIKKYSGQFNEIKQKYINALISLQHKYPKSSLIQSYIWNSRFYLGLQDMEQIVKGQDKSIANTPTARHIWDYIKQNKDLTAGVLFPDFKLADSSGVYYTLDKIKGSNFTLVVFWSAGCIPCRQEIPELKQLYKQYHHKGLQILSISLDSKPFNWKKALNAENMPWPNLSNLPLKPNELRERYQCNSIPLMYLLDATNKIRISKANSLPAITKAISSELN